MLQNMSTRPRPSLAAVLFWSILTVAWWAGVNLWAGRAVWFW